jgi:hypothetical protein
VPVYIIHNLIKNKLFSTEVSCSFSGYSALSEGAIVTSHIATTALFTWQTYNPTRNEVNLSYFNIQKLLNATN